MASTGAATLGWYEKLFASASLMQAAQHSLTIAALTATITTLIGTLTAVAPVSLPLSRQTVHERHAVRGDDVPDIVMAISLLTLFVVTGIALGFWSLLIAHITFCLRSW